MLGLLVEQITIRLARAGIGFIMGGSLTHSLFHAAQSTGEQQVAQVGLRWGKTLKKLLPQGVLCHNKPQHAALQRQS